MHMQSLKLLGPTVWEEMHLKENIFFGLELNMSDYITTSNFNTKSCGLEASFLEGLKAEGTSKIFFPYCKMH